MKPNVIIVILIALIATACGTSNQMTGRYVDDLYYWPGDTPPVAVTQEVPATKSADSITQSDMLIITEVGEDGKGNKTLDNYIYADDQPDWYPEVQARNIDNISRSSEESLYLPSDDGQSYIINNYYLEDDDYYSYSDRIGFFYDPYYYNPWRSSFYFGYGYNPYYSGRYWNSWGWNSWYWDSWYYDPWYYSWNSPYYNSWYGDYYGWYSPYYYGNHHNHHWYDYDREDRYQNLRRSSNPNAIYGGGGVAGSSNRRSNDGVENSSAFKSGENLNRRTVIAQNRESMQIEKSASTTGQERTSRGVLTEKRRNVVNSSGAVRATETNKATETPAYRTPGQNIERKAISDSPSGISTSPSRKSETPSYNKPRTNTRASYNTSRPAASEQSKYRTPTSGSSSRAIQSQTKKINLRNSIVE